MSCVDVVQDVSRCSTPNPPNIECSTALLNRCQRPLVVSAKPGSVVGPSDTGTQRGRVQSGECVHLAPGETKTLSFTTRCIDPQKAYPQHSAVHVSVTNLTVADAGQSAAHGSSSSLADAGKPCPLARGPGKASVTSECAGSMESSQAGTTNTVAVCALGATVIAGEVLSYGWILGAPASWSPYQTSRVIRWSMPMVLSSLVGVTQIIYGGLVGKFTGLLLAGLPVLLKSKIAKEPLFTDSTWSRVSSGVNSAWTLECKAFANRSAAVRIRPALEGVVATFSSRRGHVFSETVPYPEKEFLAVHRLVEETAVFLPHSQLLRVTFQKVREREVTLMARSSVCSVASSPSSVETEVSWINLTDTMQRTSDLSIQDSPTSR